MAGGGRVKLMTGEFYSGPGSSSKPPSTERLVCGECGKAFSRSWHLQDHQRTHTQARPFACAQCPSSFKQLGHLLSHQRSRHAPPGHQCPLAPCPKAFHTLPALRTHLANHHVRPLPRASAQPKTILAKTLLVSRADPSSSSSPSSDHSPCPAPSVPEAVCEEVV